MNWILLLAPLFFFVPAHAEMRVVCSAQTRTFSGEGWNRVYSDWQTETEEASFALEPGEDGAFQAEVPLTFKIHPEVKLQVTLLEPFVSGETRWSVQTRAIDVSTGHLIAAGGADLSLDQQSRIYNFQCGAYDKTDLNPVPDATDDRGRARSKYLRGLGSAREFTLDSDFEDLRGYNLFQMLRAQGSIATVILNESVNRLLKEGHSLTYFSDAAGSFSGSQLSVKKDLQCHGSNGSSFPCDVEDFELFATFGESSGTPGLSQTASVKMGIHGKIYRDNVTRQIHYLIVSSVNLSIDPGERGGGGSTSGGIIKGGE